MPACLRHAVNVAPPARSFVDYRARAATLESQHEKPYEKDAVIHAPAGFGVALLLLVGAILAGGFYLIAVRGDALFLDLAALSGLLFCF